MSETGLNEKRMKKVLETELPPLKGERLITNKDAIKLTTCFDNHVLALIEQARKNYSKINYRRGVRMANTLNDFFQEEDFKGKTILEFGPGQYTFSLLAQKLGANVICVENYSIHANIGKKLDFQILEENFMDVDLIRRLKDNKKVEGLFIRNCLNVCKFEDDKALNEYFTELSSLVEPRGWFFYLPVTYIDKQKFSSEIEEKKFVNDRRELQKEILLSKSFSFLELTQEDKKRYGCNFLGGDILFYKNLNVSL